uniref:hypothetical protein n=1 Tax=Ralstonia pseudosolanacearum TaxID=1310165 RepID=UPI0035E45D10
MHFASKGSPCSHAYRIKGLELNNPFAGFDEEMAAEYEAIATGSPVTEAVDTTWLFVEKPGAQPAAQADEQLESKKSAAQ